MPEITSKSDKVPSPRGSCKPAPLQNRVLERHINGESDRDIAIAEHIDRGTVKRIRSNAEYAQTIAEARSQLLSEIPTAAENVVSALRSGDPRTYLLPSMTLLERSGVLPKNGIEVPKPERDRERDRDAVMGQFMRMAANKTVRYPDRFPDPLPNPLIEDLRWIQGYAKEIVEAYDKNRKQAGGPGASLASTEGRES